MSEKPMPEAGAESTRVRILNAALDLIEREGISKVTTRAIAELAEVNIASINYYYRSKDALIDEAIGQSWAHMMEDIEELLGFEPWDPTKALLALATYLIEGAASHPTITRANLFDSKGLPNLSIAEGLGELIGRIAARTCAHFGLGTDDAALNRTHALVSALVFPSLIPLKPDRLATPAARSSFAAAVVEDYLSFFASRAEK
jgi:AcrR family transcriptional regulator